MAKDNYSKYLKAMGIATPYDQTEAQMEARDAENPLGRYGMMSGKDKQRQQMVREQFQAQMEHEAKLQEQAMLAQMSSQSKIGYGMSGGLGQVIQQLRGFNRKNQGPIDNTGMMNGAAGPDLQDDPAITRFNELVAEVGPETAKEIMGQELGNASMITDAQKARTAKQKESLEMEDLQGKVNDRKKKPNEVLTFDTTIDGRPAQKQMEVMGKDADGNNIYREISRGVKGSVQDTKEGWGASGSGVNDRLKEFETRIQASASALDGIERIEALIKENPAIGGWSGRLVANADNIYNGVKNLAAQTGVSEDLMKIDYDYSQLGKTAEGSDKLRAAVLNLAVARAKAAEPGGRGLAEGDIQRAIDEIGGKLTNPRTAVAVLQQAKEMLVQDLDNSGRYSRDDSGQPLINRPEYAKDLEGLRSRAFPKKAQADRPTISTKADYDKLKPGDAYIDARTGKPKVKK